MDFENEDTSISIGSTFKDGIHYVLPSFRFLFYTIGVVMTLTYGKDIYLNRKDRLVAKARRNSSRRASPRKPTKANPALDLASSANVMLYSSDNEQEPVSPQAYKMVESLPDSNLTEQKLDEVKALSDFQYFDDPLSKQLSEADMELYMEAYRISQDELLGRRSLPPPITTIPSDDINVSDTSDTESISSGNEEDKPEPQHMSVLELFSYYFLGAIVIILGITTKLKVSTTSRRDGLPPSPSAKCTSTWLLRVPSHG